MAHLLMTTTINFAAFNDSDLDNWYIPNDHFYNSELLSSLQVMNGKQLVVSSCITR